MPHMDVTTSLRDAIADIVRAELPAALAKAVRELLIGESARRGPGRPRGSVINSGPAAVTKPKRGRKRRFTAEEQRAKRAEYARRWRARQRAAAKG